MAFKNILKSNVASAVRHIIDFYAKISGLKIQTCCYSIHAV